MSRQCDDCPLRGSDTECLAVLAPDQFGVFCALARSGDETKRRHVVGRSKLGMSPASQPPQDPGLLSKAVSFGKAVLGHVAAGVPQSPPEVKAARLAVCGTCEKNVAGECTVCGCPARGVELRASWADQRCPLDPPRWEKVEAAQPPPTSAAG